MMTRPKVPAGLSLRLRALLGVRLGRLHQHAPRPLSLRRLIGPANTQAPLSFSLVTPSFNQAAFIGRTIESVLAQRYPRLDYVIQDGQSHDGTAAILAGFRDPSMIIRIARDDGQTDAINKGFEGSRGDLMGWLNSDDMLLPGTLHLVADHFARHPEVDVVYGNRLIVDTQDREVGRWILPRHDPFVLGITDYVPQETLFWRRRIWDRIGGRLDDSLHFAMDWDLLLRFARNDAVMHHLPGLFGLFRLHGTQKSQAAYAITGAAEIRSLRRRYGAGSILAPKNMARHLRFLYDHVGADAAFERSLVGNG